MPSQTETGNAFEYAVAIALQQAIGSANAAITNSQKLDTTKRAYLSLSSADRDLNLLAAVAGAELLLNLEPTLLNANQGLGSISIALQSDQQGAIGDVRDIVVSCEESQWEIGISAKHQSEDLKHSRLSQTIDFGLKWFGIGCSQEYFDDITPIFSLLRQLEARGDTWSSIANKEAEIYVPVLQAFKDELLRLDRQQSGIVPPALILYLVGRQDFYKVMKLIRQTKVQIFNFNGSLGKARERLRPGVKIEKPNLPTRILHLDFVRKDYLDALELVFDAGWHLLLRVHNARTQAEPSLKFAISLLGHPKVLQSFTLLWPGVATALRDNSTVSNDFPLLND